jgi:hypothetical protein
MTERLEIRLNRRGLLDEIVLAGPASIHLTPTRDHGWTVVICGSSGEHARVLFSSRHSVRATVSKDRWTPTAEETASPVSRTIRLNRHGTLEELFVQGASFIHLEQLDDSCWWGGIGLPDGAYLHVNWTSYAPIRSTVEQGRDTRPAVRRRS